MANTITLADLAKGGTAAVTNPSLGTGAGAANGALVPTAAEAEAVASLTPDQQIAKLPADDQQSVNQLAAQIDFTRDGIESSYGKDAQRATSTFADEILSETRSKDTGEAGELLNTMLVTIDEAELGGFRKIPIIGQVAVSIDKLRRRYQKVDSQIDEIITKLERAQARLVADISMYDTMYAQNAQQYRELKITVLAGKKALADFRATQLPALEAEAQKSGDPMQAQLLKDFKAKLDRFEKRLDDLDRISVVTLQTAPQIKIIQNADQTIVDKIDTTISTTIPVWKSQMVIALGLSNQRKALDLQNKADDVTNKLLQKNAAALHKGAVDAEKANQRSVVEIDTLEKINSELIATLKETVQIQKEGKANREAAQVKMRQIEADLKNALIENAQQM
ncbi:MULTISPECIES: toxic anion resistance protein [Bifidobacterium]|uniref:TelA-like protein associated with cryptic tellurite resistance n=1 Tax=Bifidobacterium reuteri DSM 23975 TaxID=1437610 RepID=A0A087CXT0_9BIFI|nr:MULTISPECIES: toxic anion resistance protein [Bifidobacterium]KFI88080.1 TelA-like protein associated with cryptic tellurite resistance [Bifidobacterium reuteri DSM 23975]TPF78468.1 tellurite resistance protein TelA [Bifidobacterium sp. UTCIF-1]TPF79843.1 tellurite resistance protein TelA [Bifidobacterium sp. UTCIF-24]TPF82221.1 tellurite resistance protein TelA [Bifidobacterium sp. UTCIF-3]TPF84876.1 tellurite resistance protein TelA [Bifidobacterium sp. UTCIF-36]